MDIQQLPSQNSIEGFDSKGKKIKLGLGESVKFMRRIKDNTMREFSGVVVEIKVPRPDLNFNRIKIHSISLAQHQLGDSFNEGIIYMNIEDLSKISNT